MRWLQYGVLQRKTQKFKTYSPYGELLKYRAFSLTWPASVQIHWNKRKPLRKKRVGLEQQHNHHFIALEHQYGCHDAMWKRSLGGDDSKKTQSVCFPTCQDWNLCFSFRVEWKYSFVPIPRNRYLQTSRPIGVKARHSPSYWRMDKKTKGSAA